MGEARRRREHMRRKVLGEILKWQHPELPYEKAWVAEIAAMPEVIVEKAPPESIKYMKMEEGDCHTNCEWYVHYQGDLFDTPRYRQVMGWILDGHRYICHSVLYDMWQDKYVCITPFLDQGQYFDKFVFVPDDKIEMVIEKETDDRYTIKRNGVMVPMGLRLDPDEWLAYHQPILDGTREMMLPPPYNYPITGPL